MNIPDAAVRSGTIALHSLVPIHSDEAEGRIVEAVLEAALPYLLADLRERFVVAQERLTEMARTKGPDRSVEAVRSAHLESKRGGLQLATSYLDEMTR